MLKDAIGTELLVKIVVEVVVVTSELVSGPDVDASLAGTTELSATVGTPVDASALDVPAGACVGIDSTPATWVGEFTISTGVDGGNELAPSAGIGTGVKDGLYCCGLYC